MLEVSDVDIIRDLIQNHWAEFAEMACEPGISEAERNGTVEDLIRRLYETAKFVS